MPSHFSTALNWIDNIAGDSKVDESTRFWAPYIKMRQLQTNGEYGKELGLDLRTAQPFFLFDDEKGETAHGKRLAVNSGKTLPRPCWRTF